MERPGRKALFTGSPQGGAQPAAEPAKSIDYGFAGTIASAIDAVNSGKTGVRLDPAAYDAPLHGLVASINGMFERLAAEKETQRQGTILFRENPLPMVLLDASFNLVDLNEAYENLMEQERDRLIRMEATDYKIRLLKGDKTEKTFKGIRTEAELEIVFSDGRRKIVEQYGIPVTDETGATVSAYFVYNDVTTERNEAEEIQKQNRKNEALQRRAETIVQENPMPMLLVTKDFKIVVTNEAFVTMSGIKREDVLKMSARDFKILDQKGEGLGVVIKETRKSFGEVIVDLPSGTHILEQYGIPILNGDGALANILIVYNDVTKERHEMEEVNILKKRAEAFIKENPQGITILANDKHRLDLNTEYERIWRGSYDELMRKKLYDFDIKVTGGDDFYASYETKKKAITDMEITWGKDEKSYLRLFQVPILDDKGEIDVNYYIYQDLTEDHKKMQEVQKARMRAEAMVKENPLAIAVLDKTKKRMDINKMYQEVWRGSYDELMAKKLYDFDITVLGGDDFYGCFEKKTLAVTEMEVKWPDGVKKYLVLYAIPIFDEHGEIDIAFYVYLDLTDVKQKEKEVQQLMEVAQAEAAKLNASAQELAQSMAMMAKGDLTARVSIADADPLAALKGDYNTTLTAIKELIEEVSSNSNQVENTSREVSKSADEIGRATEQVAVATQESSEFTRNLLLQIEDINREISDLSASIEEIASTSQEVMGRAQKAAQEGSKAAEIGRDAHTKMQLVGDISKESVDEITQLNEQMREISNIVKLIAGIAAQTNLLALNAAIEAARAGEHGRGFAVVAGEIRNLAGESKDASQHIEDLISTIQANSEKTASSMKASHTEIQAGIDSVNKAIEALNLIVTDIDVAAHGITEITKASEAQANATNRVMQSMEDSTTMTKENMERIEDMAALAEEVSASVEEVGSASHEMTDMAERLMKMMNQFKLN